MARSIEDILRRGERDAKRIVIDCIESKSGDHYAVKVTTKSGKVHEHYLEDEAQTLKLLKEVL